MHLDSKFPFDNYLEMIKCDPNSPEEESAKKTFETNVKAILKKIHDAREDYIEHDGGINFVMIFVPNMQVLNFVREEYDDLYKNASKKKMLFVGPSELYSILHILKNHKKLPKKVITVPKDIDRQVASDALNAMSVKIDKLTKEQKKYADSW